MRHNRLVREVLENFEGIFEGEVTELSRGEKLAGPGFMHDDILEASKPDLMGYDADGKILFVKVMASSPKSKSQHRNNVRKAIGQTLEYAAAFLRNESCSLFDSPEEELQSVMNDVALRIVSDEYSPAVDELCKLLQMSGINIKYTAP